MTIIFFAHPQQRPWRGYDDPGLPVGMWIAQGSVTGDGSGGSMTVRMEFKPEGEPVSGRYYSLEQLHVHHPQASADETGRLRLNNMGIIGDTGLVNRDYALNLQVQLTNGAVLRLEDSHALHLFLDRATLVDLVSTIDIGVTNVAAETLIATGEGYIWEPRSVMAEGGLRRPVDGLYGA